MSGLFKKKAGDQVYILPPLACNCILWPKQIAVSGIPTAPGYGATLTFTESVDWHLPILPIT